MKRSAQSPAANSMKRLANFLDAAGDAFTHELDMKYEGLSLSSSDE
jgi:hypothetical protein